MEFLGVVLDSLLIVLTIILIILSLKALDTLNKIDTVLDNTKRKLENLDNVFNLADTLSDKLILVADTLVNGIVGFICGIFEKKGKGNNNE